MQTYKVILTQEAMHDIAGIADYIEDKFGPKRAELFLADIQRQMEALGFRGRMYTRTQIYYRGYSIYKMPFRPSIIFYILKEPDKELHVLRVLRDSSNWEQQFHDSQDYTYP